MSKFIRLRPARLALTLLVFMTFILTAIGLALIFQPTRWSNTPAYANLLEVAGQRTWGAIHLAAAAVMAASAVPPHRRELLVAAHTVSIGLVAFWLIAFVVRYLTNDGTTVVNVLSWTTYLFLLTLSSALMDLMYDHRPPG